MFRNCVRMCRTYGCKLTFSEKNWFTDPAYCHNTPHTDVKHGALPAPTWHIIRTNICHCHSHVSIKTKPSFIAEYDQRGADLSSIHPWRYEFTKFRLVSWFALSCHADANAAVSLDFVATTQIIPICWESRGRLSWSCLQYLLSFPSTVPQNIVRGSAHNSGINTKNYFVFWTVHFHNWRKNRPTKCTN